MIAMKTLLIDTSGKVGIAALIQDDEIVWVEEMAPRKLLDHLRAHSLEVDQIAIGVGPGSFTGSRIGVMAAKTLSFALNKPLRPFNSLYLRKPKRAGTLVRDARSGLYYTFDSLIDTLPEDAIDVDLEPLNLEAAIKHLGPAAQHSDVQVLYLKNPA